MKKKVMGATLALVLIAGGAFLAFSTNAPAHGDDQYRTTSFSIQTGLTEPGYADAVAAFASTAPADARVVCEIKYIKSGETTERTTLRSPAEQAFGLTSCTCTVAVEEYPACIVRAYWTAYDAQGSVNWAFMRQLQLP